MINNTQLWVAALFPTLAALGSLTVAVITLVTNNSRLNSIDNRLVAVEAVLGDLRERVAKIEERLDIRLVKPGA